MSDSTVNTGPNPEEQKKVDEDISPTINPPTDVPHLNQLFKEMKVDELYRTDTGASTTIDVQPDFRYLTIQLVEHCIQIYEQIAQFEVPILTPASLLAHFLDSIYTYGAYNDLYHIRETTSQYGRVALTRPEVKHSLNLAGFNELPPFLRIILKQLEYTFDPRRKNMAYIYSFALFHFNSDCGRAFPIHMFIALHNLIAEAEPDDDETTIWLKWLNTVVIASQGEQITVANLIGGAYNDNIVENFLTRSLHKLLSPVASPTSNARPVFEKIDFYINRQEGQQIRRVNPYLYLLGNQPGQTAVFMNFRNEMRSIIRAMFPDSIPLWKIYELPSGSTILNHCYTSPTTPTFHSVKVEKLTKTSTTQELRHYADKLKFKCTWQCEEANIHDLLVPTAEIDPTYYLHNANADAKENSSTSSDSDASAKYKSLSKILEKEVHIARASDEDLHPWIMYSPWSTGRASAYYPATAGLMIETFEIDGSHVPQPSTDTTIHDENSHFLESCIPINQTVGRLEYNGINGHVLRKRTPEAPKETKVCFSLYDMTVHQLPQYTQEVQNGDNPTAGFSTDPGIYYADKATTKIAYDANTLDVVTPGVDEIPYELYAWSSYRWIPKRFAFRDDFLEYAFYITNFRTIYGTFPETAKLEDFPHLLQQY